MTIASLMNDFCARLRIEPVAADKQGHYRFVIDGLSIDCFSVGEFVYLDSTVLTLPDESSERLDLLRSLLRLSVLDNRLDREALYLDHDGERMGMYRRLKTVLFNLQVLEEAMQQFVDTLDYLRVNCGIASDDSQAPEKHVVVMP